jgi:hypothetical protein
VLEHGKKRRVTESTSGALVKLVKGEENWGAELSGKHIKPQAMYMARFPRNFHIEFRSLHGKTLYRHSDILAKLRANLPEP